MKLAIVIATSVLVACNADPPPPSPTSSKASESAASSASAAPSASASGGAAPAKVTMRRLIWTERCDAEKKYVDCVAAACGAVYKECYGDKVEEGVMGGPCKSRGECTAACMTTKEGEDMSACALGCIDKDEGSACATCGEKFGDCMMKGECVPPAADVCK